MPRTKQQKPVSNVKVRVILVDPFKGALLPMDIVSNAATLMSLLDSNEAMCIELWPGANLWVDREGFTREPFVYPQFSIAHHLFPHAIAGFGVLAGPIKNGYLTSVACSAGQFASVVRFEDWTDRLPAEDCIEQLLRVYEVAKS